MRKAKDDSVCTKEEFASVFKEIIQKHKINCEGIDVVDLTENTDILHVFADYITDNDKNAFMRLCKQRIHTGFSRRDYIQNRIDDVIPGTDESKNGIEACTYSYIDFELGILEIVFAQTAPNEKVIRKFFTKYNNNYYVELLSIPNPHSLNMLYNSKEPKIKKLELEVSIPNISYLSDILGWSNKEIESLILNGNMKLSLCLKPEDNNRGSFICQDDDSRKVIDIIKSKGRNIYKKASVIGKEDKENLREYDFFENNFSFPITVKDHCISNGNVISYNAAYLLKQYKEKMTIAYSENYTYFRQYLN